MSTLVNVSVIHNGKLLANQRPVRTLADGRVVVRVKGAWRAFSHNPDGSVSTIVASPVNAPKAEKPKKAQSAAQIAAFAETQRRAIAAATDPDHKARLERGLATTEAKLAAVPATSEEVTNALAGITALVAAVPGLGAALAKLRLS